MFSSDRKKSVKLFRNFNKQNNNDMCLEDKEKLRVSDSEVKEFLKEAGIMDPKEVRKLKKGKRDEIIKKLKSLNGVTTRQLSMMTGISKSVVDRA